MFKKLHAKLDEVLAILRLLSALMGDVKATMAIMHKDVTDGMATLHEVRALTGHTATVTAMAAQASVPTSVPVVLPPAPAPAQALQKDLGSIVAGVDPMKGVNLP
jgi:hypothetical protein